MNKKDYCILSGGSLVLHNLKEKTGDLDLFVTQELFNKLKLEYEMIDKDPVEDLEEILEFKLSRNLDKDQQDIKNIKDYLSEKR